MYKINRVVFDVHDLNGIANSFHQSFIVGE